MTPVVVLPALAVCALIGIPLGRWKGHPWNGFFAGLLLGPLGLLIMAAVPASQETRIRREQRRLQVQREAAARMNSSDR